MKIMLFLKFLVIILAIESVLCSSEDNEKNVKETDVRESREFSPESWRAVENEKIDMSGWIPHQDSHNSDIQQVPAIKRRRIRKRKRKPVQKTSSEETDAESKERKLYPPKRRLRPLRLDQNDEVWDDMEQENPKRPANRRRIIPAYNSDERVEYQIQSEPEIITERLNVNVNNNPLQAVIRFEDDTQTTKPNLKKIEKIRDPFVALEEAEKKQKTPEEIKQTSVSPELKALLKKNGGNISLSEILQKKNLTLSELLTGNIKAISALTEQPIETSTQNEFTKYHRLPPSERKKNINRVLVSSGESTESISSKEMLEAQRKRLSLLQLHKENKIYKGITHTFEIVTEPVTEKRIFVPSHPRHYSTISYKPMILEETQKPPTVKTTTQTLSSTQKISTTTETENYETEDEQNSESEQNNSESSNTVVPPIIPSFKKLPITSAKLMTRLTTKIPVTKPKIHTIPPKAIKISLDEIIKKTIPQTKTKDEPLKITLNLNNIPLTATTQSSLEESIEYEKLKVITAREEILEMLEDPINKERLSRILNERNMTIEELVEQRERGSSQLHLADIFHNKTREPEPIEEPFVGVVREEKSRKFEEEPKINPTSTTPIATTEKGVIQPTLNYAAIMPFWKQFHPEMFNHFYQNAGIKTLSEFQRIEEVDNRLSDIVQQKLDVDLQQRNYNLNDDSSSMFDMPTGVKSALFASFAIVGLSLFVFVTILVIFRWSQRNKSKLNYIGSISGAKIKSPILDLPQKNTFKSFMCETLGRKTKPYKSHLQSMSDVWDDRRQKF